MKSHISEKKKRFVKVCCPRCKNCVVIYSKASTRVKCAKCSKLLVKPTGGKTKIKAHVRGVLLCKR